MNEQGKKLPGVNESVTWGEGRGSEPVKEREP